MMLDIPLLGIQQMEQDGWGSRRHERSRDFCRLLGRDAHKSFRKNSDSPILQVVSNARRSNGGAGVGWGVGEGGVFPSAYELLMVELPTPAKPDSVTCR
jgi:hypothetical protein